MEATTYRVESAQKKEMTEAEAAKSFLWKLGTVVGLGTIGSATCFYALVVSSGNACIAGFGMMVLSAVLTVYWLHQAGKNE